MFTLLADGKHKTNGRNVEVIYNQDKELYEVRVADSNGTFKVMFASTDKHEAKESFYRRVGDNGEWFGN